MKNIPKSRILDKKTYICQEKAELAKPDSASTLKATKQRNLSSTLNKQNYE